MNINLEQRLAITKSIIELIDPSGSVTVFYGNDRHDLPSNHNCPLYITASV